MAVTTTNTPTTTMSTRTGDCTYNSLFVSAYNKPSWDDLILSCSEKYNLPQILDWIGEGTTDTSTLNWAEEGQIIKLYTIASSTGAPGTEVEVTLTETDPYFTVGDYVLLPSVSGGKQQLAQVKQIAYSPSHVLTLESVDGTNILAASVAANGTIMWVANVTAPCGNLNDGRRYKPRQRTAVAQIVSQNKHFCYDEESQLSYVGNSKGDVKYYYSIDEKMHVKEFNLAVSNMVLIGQETASPTTLSSGAISGAGILANIMTGGTVGTWAGTITEADMQDICTQLVTNSPYANGEWLVLGGATAISNAKTALKDYFVMGGAGSFTADRQAGKAGFDVKSYHFNGATLQFHNLHIFDLMPAPLGSGGINYGNALLFLNITKTKDGAATQIKYVKGFTGEVEKMIMTQRDGHTPLANGVRSTNNRCFERAYSSKFLLKMACLNSHGFFYSV